MKYPEGMLLLQTALCGQYVIFFANALTRPFHGDLVITGIGFHPVPVFVGTLAENFLAHHRNAQHLMDKMNHLLGTGKPVQVAVDDDSVEAVIYKNEQAAKQLCELFHGNHSTQEDCGLGRKTIKRGTGKTAMAGKDFRLAEEIDYIQARAAEHDGRLVTVGPLVLFSTETGDAWLLDPADHLAARLARDGDTEELLFEETDTRFAIGWNGNYQILGNAFIFTDRHTTRITTVLGYPTRRLAQLG